ncbi:MAG: outer membrane beta-barrel protein [Hyphomicrobiales bacterium]|nr:outer membrane beta-barrel protein [Hyphomicrobiales bacterium]
MRCSVSVIACVAFIGFAEAGSLKDAPEPYAPPPTTWEGVYGGLALGGGTGDWDVVDVFDYNGDPRATNSFSGSGFVAAAHLGYNVQLGAFLYGLEAEAGFLDLSGKKTAELPHPPGPQNPMNDISATYSTSADLYGALTARLGYATDRMLFFIKGGAAVVDADFNFLYEGANCVTTGDCNGQTGPSTFKFGNGDTLFGWTAGFGLEYALTSSFSLKAQYQHFDFGDISTSYAGTYSFPCSGYNWAATCASNLKTDSDISTTVDTITVGFSYRLNP